MRRKEDGSAESIRRRLRNRLRERGEDVQFGLHRYAAERFLYRLGASKHRERFVLKGATLFALWGSALYRPTRDLDFTGYGSGKREKVLACFGDICRTTGRDDGLVFDAETLRAEDIREDAEYDGLRIRFVAWLGKSRIDMQVDVGFGNAISPGALDVEYPTLLGGPSPLIRAYPREAVVAEKLQAMVFLGEGNSRIKDFYDVYVLAATFPFIGGRLTGAVTATFRRRKTAVGAEPPPALTAGFYEDEARARMWRAYRTRNRLPGAPADFAAVGGMLRAFLGPVWEAVAAKRGFPSVWAGGVWEAVR